MSTEIILNAIALRRERVTGDDLQVKREKRQELQDVAKAIEHGTPPDAERLRELLGDDDADVREALRIWDDEHSG